MVERTIIKITTKRQLANWKSTLYTTTTTISNMCKKKNTKVRRQNTKNSIRKNMKKTMPKMI